MGSWRDWKIAQWAEYGNALKGLELDSKGLEGLDGYSVVEVLKGSENVAESFLEGVLDGSESQMFWTVQKAMATFGIEMVREVEEWDEIRGYGGAVVESLSDGLEMSRSIHGTSFIHEDFLGLLALVLDDVVMNTWEERDEDDLRAELIDLCFDEDLQWRYMNFLWYNAHEFETEK